MGVNYVKINNEEVVDLRNDTVTAETLAEGVTAHNKSGEQIVGTATVGTPEYWTFTMEDGSTLTREVFVNA